MRKTKGGMSKRSTNLKTFGGQWAQLSLTMAEFFLELTKTLHLPSERGEHRVRLATENVDQWRRLESGDTTARPRIL